MRAAAVLALLTPSIALAQGADDCASAQPISGTGLFAFDNAAASPDGPTTSCSMERDVWFRWTAGADGAVTVSTCGWTTVDTGLAVYDGAACPGGAPLACGDDQCGLQSEVVFTAAAGTDYLVRVGTWVFAPQGGTGFVEITYGGSVGGCPNPSVGPNVVAGDLDLSMAFGDFGGTSAYAFATTACNLGDAELLWLNASTDHPVVAHGLYRYEDGRFEQLGTSWIKHGIGALQRDLCCTCIPSASIHALGVGCSDPYSAGLNGTQSGLSPRDEVDAFAGSFPWPPGSQVPFPAVSSELDRRLQVATDAMSPALHPTAEYLVEAVYMAVDDAAAHNGFDNASHRPYVRTGTTTQGAHDLAPAGVTERALPAIAAWPTLSATARVAEVRVPGEGAYWVGSDARPAGPGRWSYEVCVFNLNSSRPAGALSVPSGAAPSSVDMSFPRAHSGDPRSNVAWAPQVAAGRVTWIADAFATDVHANTVRWGTMYSFRFESGSSPVERVGTLVLSGGAGPPTIPIPLVAPRDSGAPDTASFCDAESNSGGTIGRLLPSSFDGPGRRMRLAAIGLPAGSIGYVLASRSAAFVPLAGGSSGNLCLGGAIGRYVGGTARVAGPAGSFEVNADLNAIPQPLGAAVARPGETWVFQAWHRDTSPSGPTSNFTAALSAMF